MTPNGISHRILAFGPFRCDRTQGLLSCDGRSVPIGPKLLDTLILLIENAGRVVEKDEMIERLWPETFVEESSLSQNIFQLRRLLNDADPGKNYIETIPKRGYRFSAPVSAATDGSFETSGAKAKGPSHSGASNRSSRVHSLAVLPFRPIGDAEKSGEYLGLGMTDAVISKLCSLRNISVLPTRTVAKYSDGEYDPAGLGLELGVDSVLDGTIQHAGGQIRLTAQLFALEENETVWSETFDHHFSGVFDVQDSIAERVASSLAEHVSTDERRLLGKRYTENSDAYQEYLVGLFI